MSKGRAVRESLGLLGNDAEFRLPGELGWREKQTEVMLIREAGPHPPQPLECGEAQVGPLKGCLQVPARPTAAETVVPIKGLLLETDMSRGWSKS